MKITTEDQVASYYKIRQQLDHLSNELYAFVHKPQYCLPFLQPGRLIHVRQQEYQDSWGHRNLILFIVRYNITICDVRYHLTNCKPTTCAIHSYPCLTKNVIHIKILSSLFWELLYYIVDNNYCCTKLDLCSKVFF